MKTKIISVFICMLMCVTVFSVTGTGIVDETASSTPSCINTSPDPTGAPWDLLFEYDISGSGGGGSRAGGEFDGTYFYATQWNAADIDKFDIDGNFIETFSIPGVTGLRDLAWDGNYMYGGAAGGTIWEMDFNTQTLISAITGSFESRAIAYNSDQDVFYCSNWGDPVFVVDRTGTVVSTINLVSATSTYGMAYDTLSDGSPYLWVFDQGQGANNPQYIHQYDLDAGMMTGFTYDVNEDIGSGQGIAGGLFLTVDYDEDIVVIGGIMQDSEGSETDYIFGYELCDAPEPVESDLECSGELDFVDVEPGSTVTGTITVENVGLTGSELSWEVLSYPDDWGTWTFTPDSGTGLLAGDTVDIDVEIVAPDEEEMEFDGEIELVNTENGADKCTVLVSLVTPVSQSVSFLEILAQRFPILAKILELIL
jgi:hypothetical protein